MYDPSKILLLYMYTIWEVFIHAFQKHSLMETSSLQVRHMPLKNMKIEVDDPASLERKGSALTSPAAQRELSFYISIVLIAHCPAHKNLTFHNWIDP